MVYDKDGKVYAVDAPDLPSHADRPEFIAAMADGSASATRESQTMQEETHYYARRIVTPEGAQVLRVGEDVANIWGLSAGTLPLLCGAVVVLLLRHGGAGLLADPPPGAARTDHLAGKPGYHRGGRSL